MMEPTRGRPKRSRDLLGLFAFIILCLEVSGGGGAITATSVDTWYQALEKPPFNPPDWVVLDNRQRLLEWRVRGTVYLTKENSPDWRMR